MAQITETTMIHYGKTTQGDLEVIVSSDDVREVYGLLSTAGLLQRRAFDGLRRYVEKEYAAELRLRGKEVGV